MLEQRGVPTAVLGTFEFEQLAKLEAKNRGIEALPLADPLFNLDSVQATTHPVAPLIVVNSPIGRELGINAGYNAFGQGFRANVTIARAVRLVLMNVGGGLPGTGDRATQGSPSKIA